MVTVMESTLYNTNRKISYLDFLLPLLPYLALYGAVLCVKPFFWDDTEYLPSLTQFVLQAYPYFLGVFLLGAIPQVLFAWGVWSCHERYYFWLKLIHIVLALALLAVTLFALALPMMSMCEVI